MTEGGCVPDGAVPEAPVAHARPRRVLSVRTPSDLNIQTSAPVTLPALLDSRRSCRGPIPYSRLSFQLRKDFAERAAEEAVQMPDLAYMGAALRVCHKFGIKLHNCDRQRIKKAISRRASVPRTLNSIVGVYEDRQHPDSVENLDPVEPVQPEPERLQKSSTARGRGRHRCTGRKRKNDLESDFDKRKRPFKGAESHKDYQSAVKKAIDESAKEILDKGISTHAAGKKMREKLAQQNVQLGLRRCQEHIKLALANGGTAISPQKPGGVYVPSALEKSIGLTIRWFRERKMPVFPEDVKEWANQEIEGTPFAENFRDGKVSEGWYRGFLQRQNLVTGHLRPLEMARHQWYSEENLKDYYEVAKGVLLEAGVAEINPAFDPEEPLSQELIITHPERIASYDETKCEMDCTKGGKGNREKTVRDGYDDDGEGVVTKSDAAASAACGRLADNRALPPMLVFNSGDSMDAAWTKHIASQDIKDKDGNPLPWQYQCNDKGSFTEAMIMHYANHILHPALGYPKPRTTHPGHQGVVICDGVGVHIGYNVIQEYIKLGISVLLRVPNLSSKLQGEDLISFLVLKGDFRKLKQQTFVRINLGRREKRLPLLPLGHGHLVDCFHAPWEKAFTADRNKRGWELEGVIPFTKKQLWKIRTVKLAPSPWELAGNHVSTRASRSGPVPPTEGGDQQSALDLAPLAGSLRIPNEVQAVIRQASALPQIHTSVTPGLSEQECFEALAAEYFRIRGMLEVATDFIGKSASAPSQPRSRARVTASQLFRLKGGATGDAAVRVQAENQAAKDSAHAEKEARATAAAAKKAEAAGKAARVGMGLLQRIAKEGRSCIESFRVEELKDLLIYSDPSSGPKGKKEDLKTRVYELPIVRQAISMHNDVPAGTADVLTFPRPPAGPPTRPPVPPAIPAALPPRDPPPTPQTGSNDVVSDDATPGSVVHPPAADTTEEPVAGVSGVSGIIADPASGEGLQ